MNYLDWYYFRVITWRERRMGRNNEEERNLRANNQRSETYVWIKVSCKGTECTYSPLRPVFYYNNRDIIY